jgi:hypothetical protein
VGQTLYVVSTSANDAAAGTGARTVRITYLDANSVQTTVDATLNGLTAVSVGTGFTYIQWMEVLSVGSTGISQGDIALTSTNGAATVATTFEIIKAQGNRSLSGRYKVPLGKTAYIVRWGIAAIGANMDARLRVDMNSDGTRNQGVLHFVARMYVPDSTIHEEQLAYVCVPELCEIIVSVFPGSVAATKRVDVNFFLIVINNT